MYVQYYKRKKDKKEYNTAYIVESYRENGKIKHRHLASLSELDEPNILKIKKALSDKTGDKAYNDIARVNVEKFSLQQGKACGGLIGIKQLCDQLGITGALGSHPDGMIALLQIMGRILCQRSRLYISRHWSLDQGIEEVLGIQIPSEDRLYNNLDWLASQQQNIEDCLFAHRHKGEKLSTIYLYDVTSSYFEGSCNELAAYGYNRDGKRGKMQIVVGLMCDQAGYPVSIEVFEGNTSDVSTVSSQLQKLRLRFGLEKVVFVGDRGMIKASSIEAIQQEINWYYLTAITKPQIETLISKGVLQLELFSDEVLEVQDNQTRYVLRRNPERADQIRQTRIQKRESVIELVRKKNKYLTEHKKAKTDVALKAIREKAKRLQLAEVTLLQESDRKIIISFDEQALQEAARLDGCYVIKSNLPAADASKETLHNRYKDLAMVEQAFRTLKQSFEQIRPIYVRKENRTRGHVFVCFLAYMVIKHAWENCKHLGLTQTKIFESLDSIQYVHYKIENVEIKALPAKFLDHTQKIIDTLKIKLPKTL